MKLLGSIIAWILGKLFGGDKAAEQSEQLGELKNDQKSRDAIMRAVDQSKKVADDLGHQSDADVDVELRRDWSRPE